MSEQQASIFEQIKYDLAQVKYGVITITIHNTEITQVDVLKKKRFEKRKNKRAKQSQSTQE